MNLRISERLIYMYIATFSFIFVVGLWSIDIGASMMIIQASTGIQTIATNGWIVKLPIQQYHIGLWTSSLSFIIITSIAIHYTYKCKRGENENK